MCDGKQTVADLCRNPSFPNTGESWYEVFGAGPHNGSAVLWYLHTEKEKVCPHKAKNDLYKLFYIVTRK